MRFRRRLSNFEIFRERLNVPLVAVELAYDFDFQLQDQDAEILIQLRGGAVLWQKERLLNLALQALPRQCRKIAWLDCDVIFGAADWAGLVSELLDRFALAQIFKRVHYLSPQWTSAKDCTTEVEFTRPSAAFSHLMWPARGDMHWGILSTSGKAPLRVALHGRRGASFLTSTAFSTLAFLVAAIARWPVRPTVALMN